MSPSKVKKKKIPSQKSETICDLENQSGRGQFSQVRRLFLPSKAYLNSKSKIEYQLSCRLWKAQAGTNNADKLKGFLVSWSFLLRTQEISSPEFVGLC